MKHNNKAKFVTGSLLKHIILNTLLSFIGLFTIVAVELLHLYYLSKLGNTEIIAALGFATPILLINGSFFIGLMMATNIVVSKAVGANQKIKSKHLSSTGIIIALITSIIITSVELPFLRVILTTLNASPEVANIASKYLYIIIPSIIPLSLALIFNGIMRSIGDFKRTIIATLATAGVAMCTDPLLIIYFDLGVQGAAISSVLSRIVLFCMTFHGAIIVHKMFLFSFWKNSDSINSAKSVLYISIPIILTSLSSPALDIIITAYSMDYGDGGPAGWATATKITPLAFGAIFTLSGAISVILGQNLGAKEFNRFKKTAYLAYGFTIIYTLIMWAILYSTTDVITSIFVSHNNADVQKSVIILNLMYTLGASYLGLGIIFVSNAVFNSLGKPYFSVLFGWSKVIIGGVPFILIFEYFYGLNGIFIGPAIGSIIIGILSYIATTSALEKHLDIPKCTSGEVAKITNQRIILAAYSFIPNIRIKPLIKIKQAKNIKNKNK